MGSLRVQLKKFRFQGKITNEEYEALIKKLDGHDEQIRICERVKTVQFVIDEFNRRTVCLGRATAKTYVINTFNEILKELKEQK